MLNNMNSTCLPGSKPWDLLTIHQTRNTKDGPRNLRQLREEGFVTARQRPTPKEGTEETNTSADQASLQRTVPRHRISKKQSLPRPILGEGSGDRRSRGGG